MKYRMLALDLDDTLMTSDKRISERTYRALMEAQRRGLIVVLSSGRTVPGMKHVAEEIELGRYGGYLCAFNGARIISCETGEDVVKVPVPAHLVSEIVRLGRELGIPLLTHQDGTVIAEEPENRYIVLEAAINRLPVKGVKSMEEYIDFPVYKFIGVGGGDYLAAKEPLVREALAGGCDVYRSAPYFMEIVCAGVDKGSSLVRLAKKCGIEMSEVCAAGDSFNDISMIRAAGLGVAMANALPEVRACADYITAGNDEDGIAELIEKKIL